MKKFLACALIIAVFGLFSCKKSEDKAATQPGQAAPGAKPDEGFQKKNKKDRKNQTQARTGIDLYNETNLVQSVEPESYATLANQKVKVKEKQMNAILLKDLLKKYNLQGKNVILSGPDNSSTLTWDQANQPNIYVFFTKGGAKVMSTASPAPELPRKLVKITVSATATAATPAKKDTSKKSS